MTDLPGAAELCDATVRDGIDAATTWLYRRVVDSPLHGPFIRRIDEACARPAPPAWNRDARLAIVPGASYKEAPDTDADGRVVREVAEGLGLATDLVPIATTGSVRQNARTLCDWLLAQPERPLLLASLSKGGPDIKLALAEPDAERAFARVAGWINLCGILDGTPVADLLLSRRPDAVLLRVFLRLRGRSPAFLRDLRYGPGGLQDVELRLPPHIQLISIVGFPLREHLTRRISRRCHAHLARHGPNDGGVILSDVCALPGLLYPIWGADHFLQPKTDVRPLMAAILQDLGATLNRRPSRPRPA